MDRPWDWEIDKWTLGPYSPGQLVLRRTDGVVCQLVDMNSLAGTYLADDGEWVEESDLEDPLLEGRKRDVIRAEADARRRAAIARGDFATAFPSIWAGRPPEQARRAPPLSGWLRFPGARVTWALILLELMAAGWLFAFYYAG